MIVLGITGGLGCGKTTVARMFQRHGAKVIDADQLAHQALSGPGDCFSKIIARFGTDVLSRGRIDRKKLSAIVFDNPKALKILEDIIHPQVINAMRRKIKALRKEKGVKCVVADVPLLFESEFDKDMDYIVVVKAKPSQQVARTVRRLSLTHQEIFKRIKRQMPLSQKIQRADIIIDNGGSREKTRRQVRLIWQGLAKRRK